MPHKLNAKSIPIASALAAAAASIMEWFVPRAFPDTGGVSRSRTGTPVKSLTAQYRRYKSGTVVYSSPRAAKSAKSRRSAHPGAGPLVEGRRLTPRSSTPDARLTDKTAKEFGVVRTGKNYVTMGWRSSRGKTVAASLQQRNKMLPISASEKEHVRVAVSHILTPWIRSVKITGSVDISL